MKHCEKRKIISVLLGVFLTIWGFIPAQATEKVITNGTQFTDTAGNIIHAHGGGMIQSQGYYYWYGEHRDSNGHFLGVSCYRSTDLISWEYRGDVLKQTSAAELQSCWVERPKVMYNKATGKYVMWMHWEDGVNYGKARCAVAYSSNPDTSYVYQGSFRPCQDQGVTDHGLPGYMSRDCNVFVDTDGTGYFISTSNENMDLHLYRLTSDYRNIDTLVAKLFVGKQREAPCLFKRNSYYFLVTSGCTGWSPNQGKYAYSPQLESGWSALANLGDSTTYHSQPAFIIPVQGSSTTSYLYTGDRWAGAWSGPVMDSKYVWLPLRFNSSTSLSLYYGDIATVNTSTGSITIPIYYKLVNRASNKLLDVSSGSTEDGGHAILWGDNGGSNQQWRLVAVNGYQKLINRNSGKALDVSECSTADSANVVQWTDNGGTNQQWKLTPIGDGWYKVINRNSGKLLDAYQTATKDGTEIVQYSDNGGSNQHWKLVQTP